MTSFFLLSIAILGAVVSFLIALIQNASNKQNQRWMYVLITIGLLVVVIQILGDHAEKEVANKVVGEIKNNVQITIAKVEQIRNLLQNQLPSKIGTELVRFPWNKDTDSLLIFAKGRPDAWEKWANWVTSSEIESRTSALSLTVESNRTYKLGLLLAYLLTNSENKKSQLMDIIESNNWVDFPKKEFFQDVKAVQSKVNLVLFFAENESKLVGFADADYFTQELIIYKLLGKNKQIEMVINESESTEFIEKMTNYFHSFNRNVIQSNDAYEIVKKMLAQSISDAVVISEENLYVVNLEKVVKLLSS